MAEPVVTATAVAYAAKTAADIVKGWAGDVSAAASSVVAFIPSIVGSPYSNALVDRLSMKRPQLAEAVTGDLFAKECHETWYVPCGPVDPASRGGRTAKLVDGLASEVGVPGSMRAALRSRIYKRFHNGPREAAESAEALRQELAELKAGVSIPDGDGLALSPEVVVGAAVGAAVGGMLGGKVGVGAGAVVGGLLASKVRVG